MPIARSTTTAHDAKFCLPTGHLSYRLAPNGHVVVSEMFYSEICAAGVPARQDCIAFSEKNVFDRVGIDTCQNLYDAGLARGVELRVVKLMQSGDTEHIYPDAKNKADPLAVEKMRQCLAHYSHTRFDALGIETGRSVVPEIKPDSGEALSKKLHAVDQLLGKPDVSAGQQLSF